MTKASKEDNNVALARLLYIYYPLHFWKNTNKLWALLDLSSEVNTITLAYASKLGLRVRRTNVRAQKIDGSTFDMFEMVLVSFQIEDKQGRVWYFQKTFLLADISVKVVLGMPFLILSNANIQFNKKKLTWRSYIIAEALPITKQVELMNKKEFVKAALDKNSETFVVHIATLEAPLSRMTIHFLREAQIAALKQNEALTKVSTEYSNFADIFSEEKALVLPE